MHEAIGLQGYKKMDTKPLFESDCDFESTMELLDRDLQKQGAPIIGRELRLALGLSRKLGIQMLLSAGDKYPAVPGQYTVLNIGNHISSWAEKKYGNRLTFDPNYGRFATILQGDAWSVRIPMVVGQAKLVCDHNLRNKYPNAVFGSAVTINLLELVDNLTESIAGAMSENETQRLRSRFLTFYNCHRLITTGNKEKNSLARLALLDLNNGAQKVVRDYREYGSARWDALQAAEKFLKHFIATKGQEFPWSHDLSELADQAQLCGPLAIRAESIALASANASTRYTPFLGTVTDVVRALDGASEIGLTVAKSLYEQASG